MFLFSTNNFTGSIVTSSYFSDMTHNFQRKWKNQNLRTITLPLFVHSVLVRCAMLRLTERNQLNIWAKGILWSSKCWAVVINDRTRIQCRSRELNARRRITILAVPVSDCFCNFFCRLYAWKQHANIYSLYLICDFDRRPLLLLHDSKKLYVLEL